MPLKPDDLSPPSPYAGRAAALATMHGKERAISPALEAGLGLRVVVPSDLDTDTLGTFTGEIERPAGILETAVRKAKLGMEVSGLDLGIASEGSYGPHPVVPFLPLGRELIVFVDAVRGIAVHERLLAETTNFAHTTVDSPAGIGDFLERTGFPEHALIVRPNAKSAENQRLHKGVRSLTELREAIGACSGASPDGQARLETDMRAHMNPTRMQAIERLSGKLVERLATPCPRCASPGFGQVDAESGLPCAACGAPTELLATEVFGCPACDYTERRPRGDGVVSADPGQCPFCNP